ncbi:MAG TPA: Mur ligase family protein [Clostridiaceae bacterium]|nr:Mur ligase family protein [Clostridiaceae bacterium]
MVDVNKYLKNFYRGTKNPSLKAMRYFMNIYDNFEGQMNFIHIAGTNGKGSCTEIISNILINQGYKVGKFLSPHLIRYNERISINGEEISDEEMLNLIEELKPLIDKYNEKEEGNITLFELETTMALLYFYRKNVDFVVLETGLGGLYDCTNIITKPLVSIITSIGYDHMNILGNTLPEISYQKAGIIKENSNTVIFEQQSEVNNVFVTMCKSKNNNLHIVKKSDISNYSFDSEFQYFDYKEIKNLKINLKGKMQIQNASICIETMTILKQLGYNITEESIEKGLKNIVHKGRMEQLNDKPIIVYDGAHNEPAIQNLQNMIQMYYTNFNRVYIIAILKRKDYNKMLKLLAEDKNALYVLTSGNATDGYATSDELYECMKKYVPIYNICKKSLADAIEDAMSSEPNIANFIIGSFYMYGTVVNKIEEVKNKKLEKLRVF